MSKDLRVFKARDIILKEGEPGTEAFYIVKGEAQVEKAGRPVSQLKEGDYFGEMSLLLKRSRSATVTALTPMVVEVINQSTFEGLLQRRPAVARQILIQIADRLARMSERAIKEQATLNALGKLSFCNACAPQAQTFLDSLRSVLEENVIELDDWPD